jgi:hypothetical protein
VNGTAEDVFVFLAHPDNLPRWAVGFCQSVRPEGDHWIVKTAHAEVPLWVDADRERGTIDFRMQPSAGADIVAYSRVVPNGDAALYTFTQFQVPGMPDAVFEGQVRALRHELDVLKGLFAASRACPA